MKIVINKCYGGFGVSLEAVTYMAELGCLIATEELEEYNKNPSDYFNSFYGYTDTYPQGYKRNNPYLVKAVETLGEKANSPYSKLKVVEIPEDVEYEIHDYDGIETIHEKHRTWA